MSRTFAWVVTGVTTSFFVLSIVTPLAADETTFEDVESSFPWDPAARRVLPPATELAILRELTQLALDRLVSQRAKTPEQPDAIIHYSLELMERIRKVQHLRKELNPEFHRQHDWDVLALRLELFAALQNYESLREDCRRLRSDTYHGPASSHVIGRSLDLVNAGAALLSKQLRLAETQGVDREQDRRIAEELKRLRTQGEQLSERAARVMRMAPAAFLQMESALLEESEQLTLRMSQLIDAAWELCGGSKAFAVSKLNPVIDQTVTEISALLNSLETSRSVDPSEGPHAAELRTLLHKKVALLREAVSHQHRHVTLGIAQPVERNRVPLLAECVATELELCQTIEQRIHLCSQHLCMMVQCVRQTEAEYEFGRFPRYELVRLQLYLLDARILLLRQQRRQLDEMQDSSSAPHAIK